MHNAGFLTLGLNAHYALRPLGDDSAQGIDTFIGALLSDLREGKLQGANITTPLKEHVARHVVLHAGARRAGAVNTLWVEGGEVHGMLTDIDGVRAPVQARIQIRDAPIKPIGIIIGSGGAARAATVALDELGYRVHLIARNISRAKTLLSELRIATDIPATPQVHSIHNRVQCTEVLSRSTLIVQATPVGRHGESHPFQFDTLTQQTIAFDMLYLPFMTPFLEEAAQHGAQIICGWEMLLAQGVKSFEQWTNKKAPVEAMRKALREQLT